MSKQLTGDSPKLDFLRTVAVLMVVGAHVFMYMGDPVYLKLFQPRLLGVLGVVLFFVHTSLVLMLSLERQKEQMGSKNWVSVFYLRRAFRIYPLSMAAVLLTYFFSIPIGELRANELLINPNIDANMLLANLALVQNFFKKADVLGPLWSLPLEMQMYLLLPLCFWLGQKVQKPGKLHMMWAYFALIAFVIGPRLIKFNESLTSWQIPELLFYLPCFWGGIIAWRAHKDTETKLPFWVFPLALAGISTVFMLSYDHIKYVFAAYACATILPYISEPTAKPFKKICQMVAKYSYGIYLFHYFAILWGFQILKGEHPLLQWSIFAMTLVGLSVASFHLLEQPFIRIGNSIAKRHSGNKQTPVQTRKSAA